ncbi:hypothetical protein [Pseudomonas sp. 5P_5.1_Bac1]|nr:hypothetical protein [Pseudomonas sp. 5P_5.1_Bac1]MCU1724215.1 hypothetical protein [Pseudomonas sp. 5P_5.1_Bac1]
MANNATSAGHHSERLPSLTVSAQNMAKAHPVFVQVSEKQD